MLKILLHYPLASIVVFVKVTDSLLLILVSFLPRDSLMIFKIYCYPWGSALSLWNILVWVSFYLSHLPPPKRSFALFLSGSNKYQSGIGSAMCVALGSLIHPDDNTSVFSDVAVLWNPSLLRRAFTRNFAACGSWDLSLVPLVVNAIMAILLLC